jgi:hypothetical protein
MTRNGLTSGFALLALAAAVTFGCENRAERAQQRADESQRAAEEKSAAAQREANDKIDQAQREANEQVAKANLKAAEDRNTAVQTFNADRADMRDKIEKQLADNDKTIADSRIQADKKTGKDRDDLEAKIRDCQGKRSTLESALRHLDTATPEAWVAVRDSVDKDMNGSSCSGHTTTKTVEGKRVIETRHNEQTKPATTPVPSPAYP